MDALIKLGLELPGVLPDHDRIHPHPWLDRFLSVQEWIAKAFESIKDLPKGKADSDLAKALETVAPWVESAAKVLPPAHFLVEIVKELTKETIHAPSPSWPVPSPISPPPRPQSRSLACPAAKP